MTWKSESHRPAETAILPITTLSHSGFASLEREAALGGYIFLSRMQADWNDGSNRFERPGEFLLGAFQAANLIAVGGLNQAPYINEPNVGRLRHLYVGAGLRRGGIGGKLVRAIIDRNTCFSVIRLRTGNDEAARLYERMGFVPVQSATATHACRTATA